MIFGSRRLNRIYVLRVPFVLVACMFIVYGCVNNNSVSEDPPQLKKNPYENVNWTEVNQYLANLHSHTVRSDGRAEPESLIYMYADAGYNILAITDHDNFYNHREGEREVEPTPRTTWPWTEWIDEKPSHKWTGTDGETSAFYPDLGKQGMLAIRGNELTTHPHILSFFNDCGFPEHNQRQDERMTCIEMSGGLSYWAHPIAYTSGGRWEDRIFDRSFDEAIEFYGTYLAQFDSSIGIELALGTSRRTFRERKLLDALLEEYYESHDIYIMGNDDNHQTSISDNATITIVLADDLTEESVRYALENGHTIVGSRADDYPLIKNIHVSEEDYEISVEIDNYDSIKWFKNGHNYGEGQVVNYSDMDETVLRFEVDLNGTIFFSQAFYVQ